MTTSFVRLVSVAPSRPYILVLHVHIIIEFTRYKVSMEHVVPKLKTVVEEAVDHATDTIQRVVKEVAEQERREAKKEGPSEAKTTDSKKCPKKTSKESARETEIALHAEVTPSTPRKVHVKKVNPIEETVIEADKVSFPIAELDTPRLSSVSYEGSACSRTLSS